MKLKIIGIFVSMLLIGSTSSVLADWDEDDGYKMHFPQRPDPIGWDVYASQGLESFPDIILGDDWTCSETGWVMDIHFWGSWWQDEVGEINFFDISIAEDIPADPPSVPYSRPGEILWNHQFDNWVEQGPFEGEQGVYNPWNNRSYFPNHFQYYQYNIFLDDDKWFWQEQDTTYWLLISANVNDPAGGPATSWGWKSSFDHYLDDAVWSYNADINWFEMYEPEKPAKINEFWVEFDLAGNIVGPTSGGTDYYDDGRSINGWYHYPNTDWWNIWFYDHPLDENKYKEMHVQFSIDPIGGPNAWFSFALNWATDAWPSGNPPPLPPLLPNEESMYVGREVFYNNYTFHEPLPLTVDIPFSIMDYNPEWVSVDFMGSGVIIYSGIPEPPGSLSHQCLFKERQSMDLAFVINGGTTTPSLGCHGSLSWTDVEPGSTVTGTFTVTNIGEPGSFLDWQITDVPTWGTWSFSPSNGIDLPQGDTITVTASVVAPTDEEETFTGNITITNLEDSTDYCMIPVSLTTPTSHSSFVEIFLLRLAQRFPLLKLVLESLQFG